MTNTTEVYQYLIPETSGIPLAPRIRTQPEITDESIRLAMNTWNRYGQRFRQLYYAYVGVRPRKAGFVETQDGDVEKAEDEAVLSNFCRYIVETLKGYIVGNPPEYECSEGDTNGENILELFRKQNKQRTDADIIQDMATYGRAFELVYLDDKGIPKSAVVSPKDAFVAYSGDMEQDSIFGCVRYAEAHDNGAFTYRLYLYTANDVQVWTGETMDGPWTLESSDPHPFGRVPLIEYCNNKEFMGDFEPIIALQNTYNRILMDRIADKDAFVKSVLVVTGAVLGMTPDEVKASLRNLREGRVLHMDSDSSAQYLEKSMDESGVQILQDQIKNDIHKFSMVPDLSDEQFANNASGVAMEYKMFGTNQMVANKALQFQDGFTRRCKLYDAALNNPLGDSTDAAADISGMKIIFRMNTPQDLNYIVNPIIQMITAGVISKDSARKAIKLISDADGEEKKIEGEQDEQAERNRLAFEADYSKPPKMGVKDEDEEDDQLEDEDDI